MGQWLIDVFESNPVGSIALILGAVFSAVFWRRLFAAFRGIWRLLRKAVGRLRRLRITDVDNLKPSRTSFSPPPRWGVTIAQDRPSAAHFQLVNWASGSTARRVVLDIDWGADLRSAAAWASLDGVGTGPFVMVAGRDAEAMGISFVVTWFDEFDDQHSTRFHHDLSSLRR